jgi:transcriptional regulator with XRE-family HTH domain
MSTDTSTIRNHKNDPEYRRLLEQEALITDATELVYELMEEKGVNQKDLAKKIGKSKGFVSQVLSGRRNMTLRTLADLLVALDTRAHLEASSVRAPRVYRANPGGYVVTSRTAEPMVVVAAMKPLMPKFDRSREEPAYRVAHSSTRTSGCDWGRPRHQHLHRGSDSGRWISSR